MKKRIAAASLALGLLVFAPTSIACLGDLCLRDPGPCYGYGCPGFKAGATTTSQKVTKHHKSKQDNDVNAANQKATASSANGGK